MKVGQELNINIVSGSMSWEMFYNSTAVIST